jgi:hypothetical protein
MPSALCHMPRGYRWSGRAEGISLASAIPLVGPMTTVELARHVMAERGLNTADKSLLQLFTRRTGALLRWQKKRGIIRSVKDLKHGRFDLWQIAV